MKKSLFVAAIAAISLVACKKTESVETANADSAVVVSDSAVVVSDSATTVTDSAAVGVDSAAAATAPVVDSAAATR